MQYNSHASELDIISDITFWTKADLTAYPIADRTRNVNLGSDRLANLIMKADGRWEFDDNNQTDRPEFKGAYVSGQQDYGISAATFLKILRVEGKDGAGNLRRLTPIDQSDLRGTALSEFMKTSGTPKYYRVNGNSMMFYPKPASSLDYGYKIYAQRNVVYFATDDTTKVPGFAQLFHRLLSLYAAEDYLAVNGMRARLSIVMNKIDKMEAEVETFYSSRQKDDKPMRLRVRKEDYGANSLKEGTSQDRESINWN